MSGLFKTILTIGFLFIIVSFSIGGFSEKIIKQTSSQSYQEPEVYLYQAPNLSSNYSSVHVLTPLVFIMIKDGWTKVGNQLNGETGWIRQAQYEKAQKLWKLQLNKDFEKVKMEKVSHGIVQITEGQKDGRRYMIVAKKKPENAEV
ncbi:hypothetical protein L3V79_03070 [Thiotrichales bacterium 19S9-12]|nr:hypothetical protein [Thiotrichales bacterium 19S9-11]MCF6811341.1 hypothetical protein [Thiotrichales bacterium 19S9-12]